MTAATAARPPASAVDGSPSASVAARRLTATLTTMNVPHPASPGVAEGRVTVKAVVSDRGTHPCGTSIADLDLLDAPTAVLDDFHERFAAIHAGSADTFLDVRSPRHVVLIAVPQEGVA